MLLRARPIREKRLNCRRRSWSRAGLPERWSLRVASRQYAKETITWVFYLIWPLTT